MQSRLAADAHLASQLRLFLVADPVPAERASASNDFSWDDFDDDAVFEEPLEPVFLALPATLRPAAATTSLSTIGLPLLSQALSVRRARYSITHPAAPP